MRQLLKDAVAADFPGYTEIAMSFPDQWELVQELRPADGPLYVAGLSHRQERSDSERFYGLPGDINQTLTTYRQYKIFQPWPQPTLLAEWDAQSGNGTVLRQEGLTIRLQPIGQAQAWWGNTYVSIITTSCSEKESRHRAQSNGQMESRHRARSVRTFS